jgi:hypothetical protein
MLDSIVLVPHCDLKQSLLHASVQIALTLELFWSFRNHSVFHGKSECPLVLIQNTKCLNISMLLRESLTWCLIFTYYGDPPSWCDQDQC